MARALAGHQKGRAALPDLGAAPVRAAPVPAAPAAVSRQRIRGALNLGTSQVRKCRRYVPENHKSESGCMKPTYPIVYS